jgi:hypothetical protein
MADVSHIRMGVPEQGELGRVLREAGTTMFPQWLYAEPADEAVILWWGIRGAPTQLLEPSDDVTRRRLLPRPIDDWSEAPRGLVLATADARRAAGELAPVLGDDWHAAGDDPLLGARCYRIALGHGFVVLAEPTGVGYAATCLSAFGEGPIAVALDGDDAVGRSTRWNPVSLGPAVYVRAGDAIRAPIFIFLQAG